jgi:hypothetical protein
MIDTLGPTATVQQAPSVQRRRLRWFFPSVSAALLSALLVGFTPTFFLRSLFDVPPIPAYLYVHGVVLTTWFVLVFAQTCLVAAHRTDLHRRLGVAAAVVAVLVVPISAFVTVRFVPRAIAFGLDQTAIKGIVIGDLVSLVIFSSLVATALYFRRGAEVHKRLMIASCAVLFGPINARLARLGMARPAPGGLILLPLLVLGVYDLIALRRLHRATMWFALLYGFVFAAFALTFGSAAADAFIDSLR